MIPAGTEVNNFKLIEDVPFDEMQQDEIIHYIEFTRSFDGKSFKVKFASRYHPGKNIADYFSAMFTDKPFDQLTAGLTEQEIYAIRRGVLIPGMSKEAVLIDYGPPPEHYTPDLASKIWHYWVHRNFRKDIYFDESNRTMPVL